MSTKLSLKKETVRVLGGAQLDRIHGGFFELPAPGIPSYGGSALPPTTAFTPDFMSSAWCFWMRTGR